MLAATEPEPKTQAVTDCTRAAIKSARTDANGETTRMGDDLACYYQTVSFSEGARRESEMRMGSISFQISR